MKKIVRVFLMLISLMVLFAACEQTDTEVTTVAETTAEVIVPQTTAEIEATAPGTEAVETAEVTALAPGETTEPPHEHTWSAWSTVIESTCTNVGKKDRICACGEKQSESIGILEHSIVILNGQRATCAEDGFTDGKQCSMCLAILEERQTISAYGHTEKIQESVRATCTENGYTEGRYCSECGEVMVERESIPALGHSALVMEAVSPTCTESGFTEGTQCAICNIIMIPQTEIAPLGHTEVILYGYAATFTENGRTDGKYCKVCGWVTVRQDIIPALSHNMIVAEAIPATCLSSGLTEGRYCSICGYVEIAQIEIAPLPHEYGYTDLIAPTCTQPGQASGKWCYVCGTVFSNFEILPALTHNIVNGECTVCGYVLSIPYEYFNATNGYITSSTTTITTEHFIFEIDPNVYVMDNFVEIVDLISNTMQNVTGMNFVGISPYCNDTGTATHAKVTVVKPEGSECGPAYASYWGGSVISACDIIDLFALIHENAHILHYRQSGWYCDTMLMESISTYTTYKTACVIFESHPELAFMVRTPFGVLENYSCYDYSMFYEYSIEEWLDDSLAHDGWNRYIVGFHFARYLDEVYGDFTKWIFTCEASYPYDPNGSNNLPLEEKIKALKMAYGEGVLDGFFPWIRENEQRLHNIEMPDMSAVNEINFYPVFMAEEWYHTERPVKYSNLCIDLTGGIYYLNEYQDRDVSALKVDMAVDGIVDVYLFDSDGKYIRTERVDSFANFDIGGVYFMILSGEGTLYRLDITGFAK